ncbi:MAG TPA: RidA family protein [Chloroflexi bacterium]|nr:RidA family protein [Chloroflexota bacterium]
MKITHHNPDTLYANPAFSQAVSVEGASRLIYIGGQNGITPDGQLAGADLGAQTEQALKNVLEALRAAGASQENVVRLGIYVVEGQDFNAGFAASQKVWGLHPTAITGVLVAGLAVPGALVEIEAVAAV